MRSRRVSRGLVLEALAAGLAYGMGLCWLSVCLLASFRPNRLSAPYWLELPGLRSDTAGAAAFACTAVCLVLSEYLRLRRGSSSLGVVGGESFTRTTAPFALAVSETVGLLGTGLVAYLSVNAVTHPETLALQATHLAPWPTEGTLRVVSLLLCASSIAVLRYLRAESIGRRSSASPAAAPLSQQTPVKSQG
jgi:hypothetical protein